MESYLVVAGMFVLAAGCIRYTVLAVRDDPLRPLIVAGERPQPGRDLVDARVRSRLAES